MSSPSIVVMHVAILHISEKTACVWVAEKHGWHWWSRITDSEAILLCMPSSEREPLYCCVCGFRAGIKGRVSFLWNLIYRSFFSCILRNSEKLSRITSNPWSWDLKWICHRFIYFSQMQQFTLLFYAFLWSRRLGLIWTQNIRLEQSGICYSLAIAMWFFWPGDIYMGRFLLKEHERFYFSPLSWFSVI